MMRISRCREMCIGSVQVSGPAATHEHRASRMAHLILCKLCDRILLSIQKREPVHQALPHQLSRTDYEFYVGFVSSSYDTLW